MLPISFKYRKSDNNLNGFV